MKYVPPYGYGPNEQIHRIVYSNKMNWKRLIRIKVYIDRGRSYIGYVQFIVTITIMMKVYEDSRFGAWFFSNWWALVLFVILFFAGVAVIGYLDKRYVRPYEISEMNSTNPEIKEILKELKR